MATSVNSGITHQHRKNRRTPPPRSGTNANTILRQQLQQSPEGQPTLKPSHTFNHTSRENTLDVNAQQPEPVTTGVAYSVPKALQQNDPSRVKELTPQQIERIETHIQKQQITIQFLTQELQKLQKKNLEIRLESNFQVLDLQSADEILKKAGEENTALRQENASVTEKAQSFAEELARQQNHSRLLDQQIGGLQHQLGDAQERIRELEREKAMSTIRGAELRRSDTPLQNVTKERDQAMASVVGLKKERDTLLTAKERAEQERDSLKQTQEGITKVRDSFYTQLTETREKLTQTETALEKAKDQNNSQFFTNLTNQATNNTSSQTLEAQNTALTADVKKLTEERDILVETLATQVAHSSDLEDKMIALDYKISKAEAGHREMERGLAYKEDNLVKREEAQDCIFEVIQERDSLRFERDDAIKALTREEKDNSAMQHEMLNKEVDLAGKESELDRRGIDLFIQETDLQRERTQLDERKTGLDNQERSLTEREKALTEKQASVDTLRQQATEGTGVSQELTETKSKLETTTAALDAKTLEVDQLRTEKNAEIERLRKEKEEGEAHLRSIIETLRQGLKPADPQQEIKQGQIKRAEGRARKAEGETATARKEIGELNTEIQTLTKNLKKEQEKTQKAEAGQTRAEQALKPITKSLEAKTQALETAEGTIRDLRREVKIFTDASNLAIDQTDEAREKLKASQTENEEYKSENAALKDQLTQNKENMGEVRRNFYEDFVNDFAEQQEGFLSFLDKVQSDKEISPQEKATHLNNYFGNFSQSLKNTVNNMKNESAEGAVFDKLSIPEEEKKALGVAMKHLEHFAEEMGKMVEWIPENTDVSSVKQQIEEAVKKQTMFFDILQQDPQAFAQAMKISLKQQEQSSQPNSGQSTPKVSLTAEDKRKIQGAFPNVTLVTRQVEQQAPQKNVAVFHRFFEQMNSTLSAVSNSKEKKLTQKQAKNLKPLVDNINTSVAGWINTAETKLSANGLSDGMKSVLTDIKETLTEIQSGLSGISIHKDMPLDDFKQAGQAMNALSQKASSVFAPHFRSGDNKLGLITTRHTL